jgi:hypothetical protein
MPTYYIDPVNGADGNDGLGWWRLAYTAGHTAAPAPGATVTGAGGATGIILSTTLSSGTWAGNNAVGYFYMYGRNATAFANGENITWTGGSATNNQGTPYDSIYSSFKTIHKTFAAGDIINIAKCAEIAQSGTATATTGSLSVTGISGWTPAAYDIIRFDTDNTLYMVRSFTGSTITLYRPYRGTTGAGKVINKLTLHVLGSNNDLLPTGGVGTASNLITVNGGMDVTINTRLGFSIWSGNYGCFQNGAFWNLSNIGFYNIGSSPSPNPTDCIYNSYFAFRWDPRQQFYLGYLRYTINGLVVEGTAFNLYGIGISINNLECAYPSGPGLNTGVMVRSTINNLIVTGYAGQPCVRLGNFNIIDTVFVDPILDELNVGCDLVEEYATAIYRKNLIFRNPTVGSGALVVFNGASYYGDFEFANINGDPTKQSKYYGSGETNKHVAIQTREDTVYHNAAPSVKVALQQSIYAFKETFKIPCDAGVTKTISVYFRKNSSYGSVTLPIMRLRWLTGTAPGVVSNIYDVTMVDTNDTFLQYSHAVTPSIKGAIIMELIFQSVNSGAIAYYDDIGVA